MNISATLLKKSKGTKKNPKPVNLLCVFESNNLTISKSYISLITQWCFSVSSICVIWVFHLNFTSVRKITKPSVMFLQNGVLILNWKENKEAGAICFEIRTPRKKNIKSKELLCKVPSKIGSYFIMEKIVNNSEYHHREMRLIYKCQYEINY